MYIITANHVKRNVRKFGMKTYDDEIVSLLNNAILTFIEKKVRQAMRKAKGVSHIDIVHFGGRVTMPVEYYGVETNHYVDVVDNNGVDMSVSNMWIRPPMDIMQVNQEAGAAIPPFIIAFTVFKTACVEVVQNLSKDATLSFKVQQKLHNEFMKTMGSVFIAVARRCNDGHVSKDMLTKVLGMQKFSVFRKTKN